MRCRNRGLGRCYRALLTDCCCSYYNDSRCVEECPSPLVGNNVTFDCGELCTENHASRLWYHLHTNMKVLSLATALLHYCFYEIFHRKLTHTHTFHFLLQTCTHTHTHTIIIILCAHTHTECGQLSTPDSGSIRYSNDFAIGSVATYTCNTGYRREGGLTQTCTFDGWDSQNVTCGEYSTLIVTS